MPLAPLAEQRRISAKLDELLGRVDACRKRLEQVPRLLKEYRQSVLDAACSGRLTDNWREFNFEAARFNTEETNSDKTFEEIKYEVPETWRIRPLRLLCTKITDGEHLTPPRSMSGVPLLSAKDVREDYLDFTETKFVSPEIAKKSRTRCNPEKGDILVVSRGATIGRTCKVEVSDEFCLMGSVLLFKPKSEIVHTSFLEYYFKSPNGLAALIDRSGATAQQAIYIRDMREFPIPLPTPVEQREIVRRVESLFKIADAVEDRYRKAQEQLDKLPQSILAKAFRGELVREDPNDEPASVLVERIRAEKAEAGKPEKKNKRPATAKTKMADGRSALF